MSGSVGEIRRVAGPVVTATGLRDARMYELVDVGDARLPGEVIRLEPDAVVIQVYEDPSGLRAGEPVIGTQRLLEVELGPRAAGLHLRRHPAPAAGARRGGRRRVRAPVRRARRAPAGARPRARVGLRAVRRARATRSARATSSAPSTRGCIPHRVLVPDGVGGRVTAVRAWAGPRRGSGRLGRRRAGDAAAALARAPAAAGGAPRSTRDTPLVTGQRVIDMVFPVPARRRGHRPGRLRDRQDAARAGGRQVVARRRRGLRRLRRARQRADRGARRVAAARRTRAPARR